MSRWIVVAALGLLCACDKSEPAPDSTAPAARELEQPVELEIPAGDDWCGRAYEDTVQIVESIKASIVRSGKEVDDSEYAPPERARYIEACNVLPASTQRCLIMEHAVANGPDCQAEVDSLNEEQRAAYNELMGK